MEGDTEFNKDKDLRFFKESEIDYIIEMMKNRYRDFKRSEMTRPFYIKALQTLEKIMEELDMLQKMRADKSFMKNYSEVRARAYCDLPNCLRCR